MPERSKSASNRDKGSDVGRSVIVLGGGQDDGAAEKSRAA
jgi:hypothetical protein